MLGLYLSQHKSQVRALEKRVPFTPKYFESNLLHVMYWQEDNRAENKNLYSVEHLHSEGHLHVRFFLPLKYILSKRITLKLFYYILII